MRLPIELPLCFELCDQFVAWHERGHIGLRPFERDIVTLRVEMIAGALRHDELAAFLPGAPNGKGIDVELTDTDHDVRGLVIADVAGPPAGFEIGRGIGIFKAGLRLWMEIERPVLDPLIELDEVHV
jgi:hypothetical protein